MDARRFLINLRTPPAPTRAKSQKPQRDTQCALVSAGTIRLQQPRHAHFVTHCRANAAGQMGKMKDAQTGKLTFKWRLKLHKRALYRRLYLASCSLSARCRCHCRKSFLVVVVVADDDDGQKL